MASKSKTVDFLKLARESESSSRAAAHHRFYGDLARFASLAEPGAERVTPVRCRKRPARKRCRGLLVVRRRDVPAVVEWECPACSASGEIAQWQHSDADLRDMELAREERPERVTVSVEVQAALRELAWADTSLVPLAYSAVIGDTGEPSLCLAPDDRANYLPALFRYALTAGRKHESRLIELVDILGRESLDEVDDDWDEESREQAELVVANLLRLVDGRPPELIPTPSRRGPRLARRRGKPQTYRIKVTLRDVRPPVWRRLLIPSDLELPLLHQALQAAMGWYDCHLHLFRVGDAEFAPPGDWEPIGDDSRGVSFDQIAPDKGSRVVYEYDFGDGWCHDILVEQVIDEPCKAIRCLAGKRRCPPEDCGGPWGYAELREALADPTHEQHAELREWVAGDFDPEEFDLEYTDLSVRRIPVRSKA